MAMIEACAQRAQPMLGVCLGHQALGVVFGGTVGRAPELLHGKTSLVHHEGEGVLAGLPSPFTATRYHSLAIDPPTLGEELVVTGRTESGIIMAVQHRELPLHGVQFHPESVLTEGGHRLLANWLAMTGDDRAVANALSRVPAGALVLVLTPGISAATLGKSRSSSTRSTTATRCRGGSCATRRSAQSIVAENCCCEPWA